MARQGRRAQVVGRGRAATTGAGGATGDRTGGATGTGGAIGLARRRGQLRRRDGHRRRDRLWRRGRHRGPWWGRWPVWSPAAGGQDRHGRDDRHGRIGVRQHAQVWRHHRDHHVERNVPDVHRPRSAEQQVDGPAARDLRFSSARRDRRVAGVGVGLGHQVRQRRLHRRLSQLGVERRQRVERGLLLPGRSTEQGRRRPVHPGHDQVARSQQLRRSQAHLRERVLQRRRHVLHARLQRRRRDRGCGAGRLPVHHRRGTGERLVVDGHEQHGLHLHVCRDRSR